jgi:broad specificity phosphatase PhoE
MQKTHAVDWPAPRSLKEELEEAARSRNTSVADLLEQIVREWLERTRSKPKAAEEEESDEEFQQRVRAAAAQYIGSIHGGDPYRSENVSAAVRANLARKYGR